MSEKHYYDSSGKFIGSSSDAGAGVAGLGCLLLIAAIAAAVLYALWSAISDYRDYGMPYNVISGFYYYLGLVLLSPFSAARWLYVAITEPGFTQFKNINLLIALVVSGAAVALPYVAAYKVIDHYDVGKKLMVALFAPAMVAVTWTIVSAIVRWLFA